MILNFGKYQGWDLVEIPLSYLAWIFETLNGKPELVEAARREIQRRVSGYGPTPAPLAADHLRRVYRTLAIEHHPDHGGDNGVMTGINLFYEAISNERR